jgi:hypothetical protein
VTETRTGNYRAIALLHNAIAASAIEGKHMSLQPNRHGDIGNLTIWLRLHVFPIRIAGHAADMIAT